MTSSVVIAVCALLFTVGSFWWLHVRRGRLRVYEPHSFAAAVSGSSLLLLRFPLILHNTGAAPIVVQDLRLRFPDERGMLLPLPWRTTRRELKPHPDDGAALPAVFAVPGRTAQQHFVEFGGPFPGLTLTARDYRVSIDARLGHRRDWVQVLNFPLRAAHITFPDKYIAYSNSEVDVSGDMRKRSTDALRRLAERLAAAEPPTDGDVSPERPIT